MRLFTENDRIKNRRRRVHVRRNREELFLLILIGYLAISIRAVIHVDRIRRGVFIASRVIDEEKEIGMLIGEKKVINISDIKIRVWIACDHDLIRGRAMRGSKIFSIYLLKGLELYRSRRHGLVLLGRIGQELLHRRQRLIERGLRIKILLT